MKVGIVGLKGSGKSTLFNALVGKKEESAFTNKDRIGVIKVPDERVEKLSKIYQPKKTTLAEITFVDLPTSVKEDSNSFDVQSIAKIREVDAIAIILRAFQIPGKDTFYSPVSDYDSLITEFVLSDFIVAEKRLETLKKQGKKDREFQLLSKITDGLQQSIPISKIDITEDDLKLFFGFRFITEKPQIVLINVDESSVGSPKEEELKNEVFKHTNVEPLIISAKLEEEMSMLSEEEAKEFLSNYGLSQSIKNRFIRNAYSGLNLVSFFTVGKDEVKAWTIKKGTFAQQAAGKIHTDLERGFIRAETVSFDEFIKYGDEAECKKSGKYRMEGKTYPVQDGDIINIKFNV